jgi:ADP-heptose:LPS heptosyltransferase
LKRLISSLLTPAPLGVEPLIIVLQLRRISEVVLTTPALHLLRETWPKAKITLVIADTCGELAPMLPRMDEVLVFHSKLQANRALLKRLLTGRFDICLDFTGTDRSALFSIASRARRRVAFEWARKGPLRALIYQKFVSVALQPVHVVDQLLELLKPIGVNPPNSEMLPILTVPVFAERRAQILLRECGVNGRFALVNPGASKSEKYWLPERWAEVILHLQHHHGLPCILTGGSDSEEQTHLRAIQTALAMLGSGPLPLPLVVLAGQLELTLLTALTARSSVVVTSDTGVMHIASAFKIPQVSLFGPTNPFEWHPRHPFSRVIQASAPLEVTVEFFPDAIGAPMSDIPSLSVCRALDGLLPAPVFVESSEVTSTTEPEVLSASNLL